MKKKILKKCQILKKFSILFQEYFGFEFWENLPQLVLFHSKKWTVWMQL